MRKKNEFIVVMLVSESVLKSMPQCMIIPFLCVIYINIYINCQKMELAFSYNRAGTYISLWYELTTMNLERKFLFIFFFPSRR